MTAKEAERAIARHRDVMAAMTRLPTPAERRQLRVHATRADPLEFAQMYFSHHLRSAQTGDKISFSDAHLAWAERAKSWMVPVTAAASTRDADIAPRETGKSTWWFLLIPMWAAAHHWARFIVAMADSSEQAETHLATFKHELETNVLLREDYPELVNPLRRERGMLAADRVSLYRSQSRFVFAARGIDSKTLGLKVGSDRPDVIILDDIEPDEASYSARAKVKRLRTLQDAVLPLNDKARVELVGTVTMVDSIVHDLARSAEGYPRRATANWIRDDGWRAHYFPAITRNKAGDERSIWPARWTLKHLRKIRHTRAYAKNYANDPLGADGDYWSMDDFTHGNLEGCTRTLLSIDPAVTTKASSDFTGLAIIGWKPPPRGSRARGRVLVKHAERVKLSGAEIRRRVLKLLAKHPEVGLILVETNQGGEVWQQILWGMPVRVKDKHQSVKKEVRAAQVLDHYQRGRVIHYQDGDELAPGLADAEGEMVAFPNAPNDDLVDAIGTGVSYFLDRVIGKRSGVEQANYAA
jgi:phage terminase large subunit-like protein